MARSPGQAGRDEYAAEHGFDSYNDFRVARDNIRDEMEERGSDISWEQANTLLDFQQGFDPNNNELSREELREWFYENVMDDEQAFYDWLHEMYA